MSNYASSTSPPNDRLTQESQKNQYTLTFPFPFNIPSTPESAGVRIVKNLQRFGLYYSTFIWTVLFIALVPQRKVSVIFLVAMTEVVFLYFLLLRALPDSQILHRIIDKRFVLFLVFVVTCVELILTRAAVHLFIVLGATVPIVVLHAVLMRTEEVFVKEEVGGEMARLVQEKLGEYASCADPQHESLV
ncbi:hypothetical protein ACS0TY_019720 [Phlomoides rotata]